MLQRRVRGHEGEVLLCHGCKGPAARGAGCFLLWMIFSSPCSPSSPPSPPLPLLPFLLPIPLVLPLLLYSSFLSPSLSASSSLSLSGPSPHPFPFSFFSPTPSPCNQKKPKTISYPFQRDTHQQNSDNGLLTSRPVLVSLVSSSWWLAWHSPLLLLTNAKCSQVYPAFVHTQCLFPTRQSIAYFSPTQLQER